MIRKLSTSFVRALSGLKSAFVEEQNFKIQSFFGLVVLAAAFLLRLPLSDFVILVLAILFLLVFELINSAAERIIDVIHPRVHNYAKIIKDMMAGAVLLASCITLIIVIAVFVKHFV